MADKSPSFVVSSADPPEVSTALGEAEAAWTRSDQPEALRALRRAVEAASDAELDDRALELAKVAADLATHISTSIRPPPAKGPSVVPPAKASGPSVIPPTVGGGPSVPAGKGLITAPKAPGLAPSKQSVPPAKGSGPSVIPPRPAAVPSKPVAARTVGPTPLRAAQKEEAAKTDRKSFAGEVSRGRGANEELTEPVKVPHLTHEPPPPRKKANSRGEKTRRSSRTDEIDGASKGADIPSALGATVLLTQVARVMLWREADGSTRIALIGKPAPADAVEAMIVALGPGGDLATLLHE